MALTNTKLLIARSPTPGKVPTAGQLLDGQLALNTADGILFAKNASGVVIALSNAAANALALTSVQEINGITPTAGVVTLTPGDIGDNGVAPLDVSGKIPTQYLPESVIGAVVYMGTYNAATNVPALPAATGNKGNYWVVTTPGTQQGLDLTVGDWVISNGTVYEKVDAQDGVSSVNGQTGVVVLDADDVGAVGIAAGVVSVAIDFSGAITFSGTVAVPDATLDTQAVNLGQVNDLISAGGAVTSVNGETGVVILTATDVGALPATNGSVSVATTFTNPVVVPAAVLGTQATNLTQVNALIAAIPAGGTVESVALAAPDTFTVTGSPVTDTGTLTFAWADVDPNLVLAGPADGSPGAPTFRALEQADLPTDLTLDEGTY